MKECLLFVFGCLVASIWASAPANANPQACAKIENDIARLECYDGLFSSQSADPLSPAEQEELRELMNFQERYGYSQTLQFLDECTFNMVRRHPDGSRVQETTISVANLDASQSVPLMLHGENPSFKFVAERGTQFFYQVRYGDRVNNVIPGAHMLRQVIVRVTNEPADLERFSHLFAGLVSSCQD